MKTLLQLRPPWFQKILDHFGGPSALARALNINRSAISQWHSLPSLRAYEIERLTNGKFKAKDLVKNTKHISK